MGSRLPLKASPGRQAGVNPTGRRISLADRAPRRCPDWVVCRTFSDFSEILKGFWPGFRRGLRAALGLRPACHGLDLMRASAEAGERSEGRSKPQDERAVFHGAQRSSQFDGQAAAQIPDAEPLPERQPCFFGIGSPKRRYVGGSSDRSPPASRRSIPAAPFLSNTIRIPAASITRRMAATLLGIGTFSRFSKPWTVRRETLARLASSACDHPNQARAARLC
jgi:hypothetical protein